MNSGHGDHLPAGLAQARRDDGGGRRPRCAASWPRSRACAPRRSCAPAWSAAAASRCSSCSAGRITRSWPDGATACSRGWRRTRGILDADSDYKETRPQLRVEIDYERAADLGVSTQEIGTTLETMMGSRRVTTFVEDGEEYDVLLQARARRPRRAREPRESLRASGRSGALVPLSSLVTLTEVAEPGTLNRFNRLRAITISASLAPGYTLGEAIALGAGDGRRGTAGHRADRLQGPVARVPDRGRRGAVHLRDGAADRVPGAGRAVRELHPPVRDHADRAARGDRRAARPPGSPAAR